MEKEKLLPKPQTDLPLPEKEISEHATPASQGLSLRSYRKPNMFKSKFFLGFVLLSTLIAFITGGFLLKDKNLNNQIACTQEAKQCPNGSYVSRTGPNCEFEKCPAASATPSADTTTDWQTYTNTKYGYSLKYPVTEFVNCGKEDTFHLYKGHTIESCSAGEDFPYLVILNNLEGTGDIEKSSYPNCYSMQKEPIIFAGISAIKYSSKIINDSGNCIQVSTAAKNTEHIILTQSNGVYNIVIDRMDKEKLVNQILSTFTFTE